MLSGSGAREWCVCVVGFAVAVSLAGCGGSLRGIGVSPAQGSTALRGSVHGGEQPVVGASIQLYAVGSSGDGSPATALLNQAVFSGGDGTFSITGDYTCPTPGPTMVYLLATGGNPGVGSGNASLSLMAALGSCNALTPSTFIAVNEVTTAGAVAALAPFMTSGVGLGSASTDAPALSAAFTLASQYVNTTTGTAPGLNVPAGATVPVAELNTLGNIIASCVNSTGGVAGDGSACGNLFALATPTGGVAPADTVMALLDLMENPSLNTSGLYGLAPSAAPFQPTLSSAPADFAVQLATGSTLSITPASLSFPGVTVGILGAPQQVLVTNTGQAAVSFSSSTLLGPNAGDFSVSNNCGSGSLAVGGSCAFVLGYQPAAAGTRNATLEIVSNGLTSTVPLAALATGASGASLPTPLADYKFLDGSGTNLTDSSGNGNNGTLMSGVNAPTWTTTGLNFSGLKLSYQGVSLPTALNTTRSFLFVTSSRILTTGAQSVAQYILLLTNSIGYTGLNIWDQGAEGADADLIASPYVTANSAGADAVPVTANGFHCKAVTLGTGGSDLDHIYIDGSEPSPYLEQKASAGIQTSGNFYIGSSGASLWTGGNAAGTFYRAQFYSNELSAGQVQSDCAAMVAEVAGRGVATGPVPQPVAGPALQAIGDSITSGQGVSTPYPGLLSLINQPAYTINNWGTPTITLLGMSASEPYRVGEQCRSTQGPVIATVMAGVNDDYYHDVAASTLLSYLSSEVATLKRGGCKVYVGTIPSTGGNTQNGQQTMDALKDAYDTLLVAQYKTTGADGIIDFAANPLLGADGAALNATYFQGDHTHPTQLGQQLLANAMSNSLNYYYGYTATNPHMLACSGSYTLASGDGVATVTPTSACALTLPDCTGPSGEQYVVNNPQSLYPVTLMGGANQPINGSASSITIPANGSVTLTDVPNAKTTSGCYWQM